MRAGQAAIEVMRAEGVRYAFVNYGITEIPFMDALAGYPDIQPITVLHEAVASGMADGYARASGRHGVAMVHTSPGSIHALGNMYNAYRSGSPLVLMAGHVDTRTQIRAPALYSDLMALVGQYTKWHWQVTHARETTEALRTAFKTAIERPTGPVYVALPRNLMEEEIGEPDIIPPSRHHNGGIVRPDPDMIPEVARALLDAKTPIVMAGNEVALSNARRELVELVELLGFPVYGTTTNYAVFPTDHPFYFGDMRMPPSTDPSSTEGVRRLTAGADLVVSVGARMFPTLWYYPMPLIPRTSRIVHLSMTANEVGKPYPADLALIGDLKTALRNIVDHLKSALTQEKIAEIENRITTLRKVKQEMDAQRRESEQATGEKGVRLPRLARELRGCFDKNLAVVEESVTSGLAFRANFPIRAGELYFSGGGGSLGWGLPGALGVKLAVPERQVLAFLGDGSFLYTPQALWTAAKWKIPVTIVIANNKSYFIAGEALRNYKGMAVETGRFIGVDIADPDIDYVKFAEGLGAFGQKVERPEDVAPAVKAATKYEGPALIDVRVDTSDLRFF